MVGLFHGNPSRAFDVVFTCSLRACVGFLNSHIVSCNGGGGLSVHLYKTFTIREKIFIIETEPKGLNDFTTGQINDSSTHHKQIQPTFKSCVAINLSKVVLEDTFCSEEATLHVDIIMCHKKVM